MFSAGSDWFGSEPKSIHLLPRSYVHKTRDSLHSDGSLFILDPTIMSRERNRYFSGTLLPESASERDTAAVVGNCSEPAR